MIAVAGARHISIRENPAVAVRGLGKRGAAYRGPRLAAVPDVEVRTRWWRFMCSA